MSLSWHKNWWAAATESGASRNLYSLDFRLNWRDAEARNGAFASKLPHLRPRETLVSVNHQFPDFSLDSARSKAAALLEYFRARFALATVW